MRNFILCFLVLSIMLFWLSCGGSNRMQMVKQLASFEVKADLATKQLYHTLADEHNLNTQITVLAKINQHTMNEDNSLRKLNVKVKSKSGDVYAIICAAKVLPKLADLDFVLAIESGKQAK